ncbi:hypothetical protein CWI71_07100 [Pseudidiomarina insulisalsae]|uniref:Outer membrane protein beta-barrel domain-containing protein n=2 Tax=Pseudidiomarina insulisalsae TaxID=575789 RepID=A0A432YI34_9GAMM|nr:hypothetical protein CWI71_07100 [Pseudidiomarina insulisalsae]
MTSYNKVFALTVMVTALAAATPALAHTQNQSPFESPQTQRAFNFLSAGIADHDHGADSIIIEGSYQFSSPWFVSAYVRDGDDGPFGNGRDAQGLKLGRYLWLSDTVIADFSGRVGNVDFGVDDSGYWGVEGNLRTRIDRFELFAGLGWVDYTDAGSDSQYQFGTRFYVTPEFAVGARYQDSEFGDGLRIEASYHF